MWHRRHCHVLLAALGAWRLAGSVLRCVGSLSGVSPSCLLGKHNDLRSFQRTVGSWEWQRSGTGGSSCSAAPLALHAVATSLCLTLPEEARCASLVRWQPRNPYLTDGQTGCTTSSPQYTPSRTGVSRFGLKSDVD